MHSEFLNVNCQKNLESLRFFIDHHKKVLCRFNQHSKNEKEVQCQLDVRAWIGLHKCFQRLKKLMPFEYFLH